MLTRTPPDDEVEMGETAAHRGDDNEARRSTTPPKDNNPGLRAREPLPGHERRAAMTWGLRLPRKGVEVGAIGDSGQCGEVSLHRGGPDRCELDPGETP